ncbi:MAG: hypothetical protein LBJ11_07195 [Oscillospiraceae bacterium]|nr:hypothetical protein [Oscillospiraceae bacterium]
MRKISHKLTALLLCAALLLGLGTVFAGAKTSALTVNGEAFSGTFQEALAAAGPGGLVEISGTVYTRPVGWLDDFVVQDVTIQGNGAGAVLALESLYFDAISAKCDVLTIRGDNVTVRNLTIRAGLRVDFPLRLFGSNLLVEDVTCTGGTRGAVNILGLRPGKTMTFRRVRAQSSLQGGFYFDDDTDCAGLTMEDCVTSGNLRVGVLVRNTYNDVLDLDLSGIRCREGVFAVEDRTRADLAEGERTKEIRILAPPQDAQGKPIDTARALNISFIETKYDHIRYGVSSEECAGADAWIDASRYGFDTRIHYTLPGAAEADCRDGETVAQNPDWWARSFGKATAFLSYLWRTVAQVLN